MTNREPLNPTKYATAIKDTAVFKENLPRKERFATLSKNEKHLARNRAIARSAFSLAGEVDSDKYMSPEEHIFNLIGNLDSFYTAQKQLDNLRSRQVPRTQKEPHLRKVIAFNHALKGVIDNNPSLEFDELLGFMTRMYMSANGPEHGRDFHNEATVALIGMQHEIGAEQIIGTLDNVEYEETTVDGELDGEDMIVIIGGQAAPIDIKASPQSAERSRQLSPNPERIIWSQLRNSDFNNSFRIPYDLALEKGPAMLEQLEAAAHLEKAA